MGEHLHLPQPLHSPRIRTVRVWSAPRRLGASLVKRQSDLGPPISLFSQIQWWVGQVRGCRRPGWTAAGKETSRNRSAMPLVGLGLRRHQPSLPPATGRWTWRPSRWLFHVGLPTRGISTGRASSVRGLKVPKVTSTDLCNYLGAPPTDSHLPLCCLPLGCFSVRSPLKLPQLGVEPTAFLQSPLFFSGSPTPQKTQLSSSYAPGSLRPTVLSPCSSRWG